MKRSRPASSRETFNPARASCNSFKFFPNFPNGTTNSNSNVHRFTRSTKVSTIATLQNFCRSTRTRDERCRMLFQRWLILRVCISRSSGRSSTNSIIRLGRNKSRVGEIKLAKFKQRKLFPEVERNGKLRFFLSLFFDYLLLALEDKSTN